MTENAREPIVDRYVGGFGIAAGASGVLTAILSVLRETSTTVDRLVTQPTGAHWATLGALDVLLFIGLGLALARFGVAKKWNVDPNRLIGIVVGAVSLSGAILGLFYLVLR